MSIHQTGHVVHIGKTLADAKAAMILIHGRGDHAHGILSLVNEFKVEGYAYLAPQATGNTWYPQSFLAPIEANEPGLSSALNAIDDLVNQIMDAGVSAEKIILLGFSQGACLATEYAARNARRYGGVVGLSGGLIGPDGISRDYPGSLDNTPVFLGCSDIDFHIPLQRIKESTEVLSRLGADVTEHIYPNMGHTINSNELKFVNELMHHLI